jgi:large subunit ribosomal protein L35
MKVKLKTKKSASKRFKITGTGKVRFRRANRAHNIKGQPTSKQSRQTRGNGVLKDCDTPSVIQMMPNA